MNTKYKLITKGTLLALLIGFIFFIYILYSIGYLVDGIAWNRNILVHGITAIIGALYCIITFMGIMIITRKKNIEMNYKFKLTILVFLIVIIIISIVSIPFSDWNRYEKIQSGYSADLFEGSILYEYGWEDVLEKYRMNDNYYLLYVGRDDCPDCNEFVPMLEKVAREEDTFIIYYNTIQDRKKNDFEQKMKMLKIDEVPSILIIGNNQVITTDNNVYKNESVLSSYLHMAKEKYNIPKLQEETGSE